MNIREKIMEAIQASHPSHRTEQSKRILKMLSDFNLIVFAQELGIDTDQFFTQAKQEVRS